MKRITKRILVLLLALLMALPTVFFAAAAQTEIVARGKYGAKINWTLDAQGTLTVTGNGNMDVYSGNASISSISPWCGDSRIKTVVVSTGIKTVGAGLFLGCENLKTVVLPESLTKVYALAFAGCSALQYVFFAGSEAKWNQIRTEAGSIPFPRLTVVGSFPRPVQNDTPLCNPDIRFGVIDWGCEDGVVWIWDDSKTLTFTGSGTVTDPFVAVCNVCDENGRLVYPEMPLWAQYLEDRCTVVLEEGITGMSGNAFSTSVCIKELIVLNPDCDLSAFSIKEPTFLRGYLDSTAERYAGTHYRDCLFLPLCPADHRHTVVPTERSEGYREGVYCADCGEFLYGHEALPPITCITPEDNGGSGNGDVESSSYPSMTGLIAWLAKLLAFFRNT